MIKTEVVSVKLPEEPDGDGNYLVEIVGTKESVNGNGSSMSKAIMSAFKNSGMWPNKNYPYETTDSLQHFLFWEFDGGESWVRAIEALQG